jgi:GTP-binding protein HflX
MKLLFFSLLIACWFITTAFRNPSLRSERSPVLKYKRFTLRSIQFAKHNDCDEENPLANQLATVEKDVDTIIQKIAVREEDLLQVRDLDSILSERAKRFYDPRTVSRNREKCILVGVDITDHSIQKQSQHGFTVRESLSELSELVGTAGLVVCGSIVQRLPVPNAKTYIGSGKIQEIQALISQTEAKTIVFDDDLSTKQQRNLEAAFSKTYQDVKILDRSAIILEIFAQHAQSREGQLQVELAMLEYRLTRGPQATGNIEYDSGCGFRGPGETKLETDKRVIRDKIVILKKEIETLKYHRDQHRKSRYKTNFISFAHTCPLIRVMTNRKRLNIPVIALVGYTNAGKSTIMNRLSKAGVFAENMLFATLDPTTRRVRLPKAASKSNAPSGASIPTVIASDHLSNESVHTVLEDDGSKRIPSKGTEVLLTDTVGFISKLPAHLIAAFRATLEEVMEADILLIICDRSSPVWEKQRETVYEELQRLGCAQSKPIIEVWNKMDMFNITEEEQIRSAIKALPVDVEGSILRPNISIREENQTPITLATNVNLNHTDAELIVKETNHDDINMENSLSCKKTAKRNKRRERFRALLQTSLDETNAPLEDETSIETENVSEISSRDTQAALNHTKLEAYYIVPASAKTGEGMNELVDSIDKVISQFHVPIQLFLPYQAQDMILSTIYQQGVVEEETYTVDGIHISCRIPPTLLPFVQPYEYTKH